MALLKDFSASAVIAGFVTVLVGFTSSAVIVFQAAQAQEETTVVSPKSALVPPNEEYFRPLWDAPGSIPQLAAKSVNLLRASG